MMLCLVLRFGGYIFHSGGAQAQPPSFKNYSAETSRRMFAPNYGAAGFLQCNGPLKGTPVLFVIGTSGRTGKYTSTARLRQPAFILLTRNCKRKQTFSRGAWCWL